MKKYEEIWRAWLLICVDTARLSNLSIPWFPSAPGPSPIEFPRWKGRSLPRWAVRFPAAVDLGPCPQGRNVGGAADLLGSVQEASMHQSRKITGSSVDIFRRFPLPFRATRDLRWRTWQHKSCYLGFLCHGIIGHTGVIGSGASGFFVSGFRVTWNNKESFSTEKKWWPYFNK